MTIVTVLTMVIVLTMVTVMMKVATVIVSGDGDCYNNSYVDLLMVVMVL